MVLQCEPSSPAERLLPGHTLPGRMASRDSTVLGLSFAEEGAESARRDEVDFRMLDLFKTSVRLRLMLTYHWACSCQDIDSSAIAAVMSEMVDDPIRRFPWHRRP